ncbi:MAG: VOC family protein [Candidatus Rokubacteria bacterium]|nr:VOC family protein [Candidatus Rokubacteria bacterium]
MIKLDHLVIPVRDHARSRDWYVQTLGLKVEFEVPARKTTALQDTEGFTLFVEQSTGPIGAGTALYFSVENVDDAHAKLAARGAVFSHPPQKTYWGYGAELIEPDGYLIRLWDETTMKTK